MTLPLPKRLLTIAVINICIWALLPVNRSLAQVANTGMTDNRDSLEIGKLKISGLVDVYYLNDFYRSGLTDRSYSAAASRALEFTVNLAYFDLDYRTEKTRARFVPGFGTYVNANNSREPGSLKNILEANVGVLLSEKKEIWLDMGIFGAPYTNETAISKNQILYTRSLAAEYSPYFLSGARLTLPVNQNLNLYLYVVNGWQQMADINTPISVASQVEYRPGKKWLINWSTYVGNENGSVNPAFENRLFNDLYAIYEPSKKLTLTACASYGTQEIKDTLTKKIQPKSWWQVNSQAQYKLSRQLWLSARAEYFNDPHHIVVQPETSASSFKTFSSSLCLNYHVSRNSLIRLEGRQYSAQEKIFPKANHFPTRDYSFLCLSMNVWF